MRSAFMLAVAAILASGCQDRSCTSNADCDAQEEGCRLTAQLCPGYSDVVSLASGYCRSRGAQCGTDADCPPDETCARDNICRPGTSNLCTRPPQHCPDACPVQGGYICACVCSVCPGADGGA